MAGEPKRSGWYVGAGAGVNWTSEMKQAGLEPGYALLSG